MKEDLDLTICDFEVFAELLQNTAADCWMAKERGNEAAAVALVEKMQARIKMFALALGITKEVLDKQRDHLHEIGLREILVPLDFEGRWHVFKGGSCS